MQTQVYNQMAQFADLEGIIAQLEAGWNKSSNCQSTYKNDYHHDHMLLIEAQLDYAEWLTDHEEG